MHRVPKLILALAMAVCAAVLVAADQWTKALAAASLAGRGTVPLVGDFAVLVYVRNRGAFLSMGSALPEALRTILLIAIPLLALVFFGWTFLRRGLAGSRRAEFAVVTLIIAGGLGNLVDRLFLGEVRDFLNFGIGSLRTGIMNLADLYILAALIVMIVAFARRPGKAVPAGRTGPDRP